VAPDRRAALVDAGISLVLEQRLQDLLGSVDTRSITERAGVTTGSFFHHFRNRAAFTGAVVERFVELWREDTDRAIRNIEAFTLDASVQALRSAADSEWARLDDYMTHFSLQHLLWAARRQPVAEGSAVTGARVLGDGYREFTERLLPHYARALEALGREPLPPFDLTDLAVTLHAVADGLETRRAVDDRTVRPTLYADLSAALVIALTRPAGERAEVHLGAMVRELRVAVAPSAVPSGPRWRHIADAAAPLFVDRRVRDVKVADIAAAAGVSPSTVHHHFASVSEVAACGWARHLPELQALAAEPITPTDGPVRRMEAVLVRLVELAKANPGALEGLMIETVAASGGRGQDGRTGRQIAEIVPIASLLAPLVRELRTRGLLRRRIDSLALSRSILQLATMRVLAAPDDPVERIIDDSLGLALEGALAGGGTR